MSALPPIANVGRPFMSTHALLQICTRLLLPPRPLNTFTRRCPSRAFLAEGVAKPIKRLQLTAGDFSPVKTVAQVVLTAELILALTAEGINALGRELRTAVAVGSDTEFLAALTGNSSEAMGL